MNEDKRKLIRTLAGFSAGIGLIMGLCAAGTSDFRDQLRYADEETRAKAEAEIVRESTEQKMLAVSTLMMLGGAIGLATTEKKQR